MKEYMTNLGAVLMMSALANMLVPEGSIKKYVSLAMGFILITAALSGFNASLDEISFSMEDYTISEEEIESAQAKNSATLIKIHRENIKNSIEKRMKHGSKAFVEVTEKGEILHITLLVYGEESEAVSYIVNTLGIPRERIEIKYDKN